MRRHVDDTQPEVEPVAEPVKPTEPTAGDLLAAIAAASAKVGAAKSHDDFRAAEAERTAARRAYHKATGKLP